MVTLNGITDLSIMGHTSCPNLRLSLVINSDWAQNQLAKLRVIELGVLGKKRKGKNAKKSNCDELISQEQEKQKAVGKLQPIARKLTGK